MWRGSLLKERERESDIFSRRRRWSGVIESNKLDELIDTAFEIEKRRTYFRKRKGVNKQLFRLMLKST